MTPQILAMNDGRDGHQIFASMYMLPARPLNVLGVNDAADAWVLTLTDARFFWGQWKRGTITVEDGVTTWANLYSQLSTIIGTTITPDTIPDEFSTPTTKWNSYAEPSATILDAVATQIGQRVVVQLDGTVSTVNWATAKGSSDVQVDNQTVISGGLVSNTDISRYIPAYVGVLFPQEGETAPFNRTRSLAAADVSGLAPCNGFADASGWVYADFVYDGSNIADVNDWADAASNAWFGWQFDDTDVVFPGIQNWFPTGWESYIEWTYQKREGQPFASTHVVRGPWDDFAAGGWQTSSSNGGVPLCGSVDTGWAAGLLDTECLFMTVLKADGLCSNIDTTQEGYMRWKESDSKWVFQEWDCELEQWVDKNFVVDTIEAPLKFWVDDASGDARLEIAGITRKLMWVCSGDGTIVFSGGTELMCGGVSPPAAVQCDNNFLIKLQCVCCPIDGWQGNGYYCIVNEGEDCDVDTVEAVLLIDPCTEGIIICSCRYDTLEEAEVACGIPVDAPCQDLDFATKTVTATLSNKTGDCSCLPDHPNYVNSGDDFYVTQGFGCPGNISYYLECSGGQYILRPSELGSATAVVTAFTAVPFSITFHITGYGSNCGGSGGTADYTITAV